MQVISVAYVLNPKNAASALRGASPHCPRNNGLCFVVFGPGKPGVPETANEKARKGG
jgi:hypothetical protein